MTDLDSQKSRARAWFETLRDQICASLEAIEAGARFERKAWQRAEGGGGVMSMLHGKVFEKAGVRRLVHMTGNARRFAAHQQNVASGEAELRVGQGGQG